MEQTPKLLQVYVVEDSAILAQLLERTVHAAGAELVGRTGDANEAIAALSELPADLVVLDIVLAAGSGFDVLKALTAPGPSQDAFRMVLTNYVTPQHRTESFKLGADCFFDKSTEAWQAIEVINRLAIHWATSGGQRPGVGWLCPGYGPPR
jgi:DNA-binding NarL/FixJ family response regulator